MADQAGNPKSKTCAERPTQHVGSRSIQNPKPRVLIVEDDSVISARLQDVLTGWGYVPLAVASGETAVQQAVETRPDLVLMDIRLAGEMDGVEAAARIRAQLDVPVVYLTAHTDEATWQRAKTTEPYGFLVKPVRERELLPTIEMALYKHQLEQKLKESEERSRAVVETANEAIITIDNQGVITSWNKAAESIFGYTPAEAINHPLTSMMPTRYREAHQTDLERVASGGKPRITGQTIERVGLKKDGSEFPLELSLAIGQAGEETFFTGIARDITDIRQATNLLQQQEKIFHILTENMQAILFMIDADGIFTLSEGKGLAALGLKPGQVVGMSAYELYQDYPDIITGIKTALAGQVFTGTINVSGVFFDIWYAPQKDSTGNISGLISMAIDVTEHKQAEAALQNSRNRFRNVITSISDHIYVTAVNPDGSKTNLYFSPNIEALTGYPLERFLADWNFWPSTVIHPDDRAAAALQAQKLSEGQNSEMEYRLVRAGGEVIWVRDSGQVVDEADGRRTIYGVTGDITGRKQAEAELRRRNRELTLLNQIITASATITEPELLLDIACRELALACKTPRATATLLNKTGMRATVVAEYSLEGQPLTIDETFLVKNNLILQHLFTHKTSLAIADAPNDPRLAPLRDIIRRRGIASLLIVPLVVEGEVIGSLNLESSEPRRFSTEEISLVWHTADQVAVALARLRLSKEQRLLNTAVEQAAECIVITDTKGNIIYVNPAFERVTGYSRAEVMNQNPRFLKSGRQDDFFYKELWAAITAGQVWQGRFINKKKNGDLYTEEATITPVRDDNGDISNYVAVKRDVTRELRLEEQFHQAQKMESIGRLAGGVAHDFNNILATIIGHSELLLAHFPNPDDPRREEIEQIEKAGQRAARLTRQLLAFSRRRPFKLQTLNLNEVVADMEQMLGRLIGEDIALITHLAPDLCRVKADPGQLEQVLLNLVVNARDAMPRGGKLTIQTTNIDLNGGYTELHLDMPPGPYAQLCVSDTGLGMDAETRAHIFEPFFTTKRVGQGTGLGLSTVHGIVKQSGGYISVYSEPGQGTTFKIYLPRTTDTAKPAPARQLVPTSLAGTETILLVEDNPGVRLVIQRFLQMQDYTVLEAPNAEVGLQLYRQHQGQINLLITDVIMPGMSGPELAAQLTQSQPNLKVIYTSGYTDDRLVSHGISTQNAAFLEKPFSSDALVRTIRKALNAG